MFFAIFFSQILQGPSITGNFKTIKSQAPQTKTQKPNPQTQKFKKPESISQSPCLVTAGKIPKVLR